MKSPCYECEKAFVGYMTNVVALDKGVLQAYTLNVYAAHKPTPRGLQVGTDLPDGFQAVNAPFVMFNASTPKQVAPGSGIYELKMTVAIETDLDVEMDIPYGIDVHELRIDAVRKALETPDLATTYINNIVPETQGYTFGLTSIEYVNDDSYNDNDNRHMTQTIEYYICGTTNSH